MLAIYIVYWCVNIGHLNVVLLYKHWPFKVVLLHKHCPLKSFVNIGHLHIVLLCEHWQLIYFAGV